MLTTLIITGAILIGIAGVGVATLSILSTRKKYPSSKRIDAAAEKAYAVVIDFIRGEHSGEPLPEQIPTFEQLPDEAKAMYRELAKRHLL